MCDDHYLQYYNLLNHILGWGGQLPPMTPLDPPLECSKVYIGETGRNLKERMRERRYAVKNMNNGIEAHAWQYKHDIDWGEMLRKTSIGRGMSWRLSICDRS